MIITITIFLLLLLFLLYYYFINLIIFILLLLKYGNEINDRDILQTVSFGNALSFQLSKYDLFIGQKKI